MTPGGTHLFLTGLALSAGVLLVTFLATWALAIKVGRWSVVDSVWGASFVLVAAASFIWSTGAGADMGRRVLTGVLTAVWGLRLTGHIAWRGRRAGEDPRYTALLGHGHGPEALRALVRVFLPQAAIAWVVSLPVQAAMYERSGLGVLGGVGAAVWAVGLFFESVGDAQLATFRRDPTSRHRVMDTGLWRYTRHPNYFGDTCVWFGLYLLGAAGLPGAALIGSPLVMLYFLYVKSGKGLLEARLSQTRPGYADYMCRTSGFLPLPPRRQRLEPPG